MSDDHGAEIREAIAGNTDALCNLLKRHAPAVRASLAGQIPAKWRSVLSEDDVLQQTFTDAFLDIANFNPNGEGSLGAWLCRLARCNLYDALRMLEARKRGGGRKRVELDRSGTSMLDLLYTLTWSGNSPSGCAAGKEVESLLAEAMKQLPPNYQTVVRLFDLEGVEVEEIARQLQRSPGAVYMLRIRAHDRLRALLGASGAFFTMGA